MARPVLLTALLTGLLTAAPALCALSGPAVHAQAPAPAAATGDAFAARSWHAELAMYGGLEAWNYNGSHEKLSAIVPGFGYGLGKGVVLVGRAMLFYIGQRGPDGFLLGATIGARGRFVHRPQWSLFWEGEVGISQADTYVPRRGTRFNYLAIGGIGATVPLGSRLHLLSGLRLIHISNGGLAGRDRNPDIEAIGAHLGLMLGF
jgi:hypothetical protein